MTTLCRMPLYQAPRRGNLDMARRYLIDRAGPTWPAGGSRATSTFAVENPADESTVAEVAATPLAEIERAVVEARRSFDSGVWADLARRRTRPSGRCTASSTIVTRRRTTSSTR